MFVVFALLGQAVPAAGDVRRWFKERPRSPYQFSPILDISLLAIGVPAWLGSYYTQRSLSPPTCGQTDNPCSRQQVPWFDRPLIYANGALRKPANLIFNYGPLIIGAALFLDYGPYRLRSYLLDITMAVEAFVWSGAISHVFRFATRRPRPYLYIDGAYPGERSNGNASTSFYSGHVAELFAFGVTLSWTFTLRHGVRSPWTWVMWTALLGTGTAVGVLRVGSGDHFLSDVVVGALVGTGIGLLVPLVHRRNQALAETLGALHPVSGPGYGGISFVKAF